MGKRKIDPMAFVEDRLTRDVTYSKRKRGIIKKCIEFSKMCDQYVSLTIFDKSRQKLVQYSSTFDFIPKVAAQLLEPENLTSLTYQTFDNDSYDKITNIKTRIQKNLDEVQEILPSDSESNKARAPITNMIQTLNRDIDLSQFLVIQNQKKMKGKSKQIDSLQQTRENKLSQKQVKKTTECAAQQIDKPTINGLVYDTPEPRSLKRLPSPTTYEQEVSFEVDQDRKMKEADAQNIEVKKIFNINRIDERVKDRVLQLDQNVCEKQVIIQVDPIEQSFNAMKHEIQRQQQRQIEHEISGVQQSYELENSKKPLVLQNTTNVQINDLLQHYQYSASLTSKWDREEQPTVQSGPIVT